MAIITSTVGSAGGRDFATAQLWADSVPTDVVGSGNSYVGNFYNDSDFFDNSTVLGMLDRITDANHTITIQAAPGQAFYDQANVRNNPLRPSQSRGVMFESLSVDALSITGGSGGYITVRGIQFLTDNSSNITVNFDSQSNVTIDKCMIWSSQGDANPLIISNIAAGGVCSITNCLFMYDTSAFPGGTMTFTGDATANVNVSYCTTIYGTGSGGPVPSRNISVTALTCTVKNCALFSGASVSGGTGTVTTTNCMTDVASPPAGCTTVTLANQFVSTSDLRSKAGADLIGTGAPIVGITTDISQATRNTITPDIGAWEFTPFTASTIALMGAVVLCGD
jgi:hypothetical protein